MAIDITNAAEYSEVISKINLWYGNDAQKLIDIANTWELTPEQLTNDWLSGSGYEPWYTSSGAVGGYNATGTSAINYATAAQESINSNAGSVTQVALKTPVEQTINQSGKVITSGGLTSAATGLKSGLTFVSSEVLPAVSAAGLGISLGKTISKAAYDAGFNWLSWAGVDMESLNPETWNDITADYPDGALKKAFNTIFGLNPNTGETQMYLDQDAAVYLAQYLNEIGFFARGTQEVVDPNVPISDMSIYPLNLIGSFQYQYNSSTPNRYWVVTIHIHGAVFSSTTPTASGNFLFIIYAASDQPNTLAFTLDYYYGSTHTTTDYYTNTTGYTYNNKTVYKTSYATNGYFTPPNNNYNKTGGTENINRICWSMVYGTIDDTAPIEGVTDQTGATAPNFAGCNTPADYLNALQTQFPDLFNGAVTQSIVNPDGTTKTISYVPIGTPSKNNGGNKNQPVTDNNNSGNKQDDSKANPTTLDLTGLENLIKQLTQTISQTGTPTNPTNPDPTGTGNTPPVVAPSGSASALWSVYNPSQAELNSFGAWLWSSNFIDQILKLFNNPMQSIIGVHKIFASPPVSGSGSITVGYLNSGVSANLVSGQYTTVNCGTVKVREQFGNVFDYTDTHIRLYLPFIGIVDLDTADVMRGSVSVVYHVDVITGACLAEVKITRDGSGGTLYQYAGDAAVRYPISSGSYMGVVAGIASAVGGVASAVMTGGATLPLAAGAVAGGISGAQTQVQHSGNFSGNAGAMGGKKPYIIIERPQTMIADDFERYQGRGANVRRTVGQMSGYFKFSDVHTDSISGAAQSEIEAIRAALESGVIA